MSGELWKLQELMCTFHFFTLSKDSIRNGSFVWFWGLLHIASPFCFFSSKWGYYHRSTNLDVFCITIANSIIVPSLLILLFCGQDRDTDMKAFRLRLGGLKFKMITKWWNQPKDLLAAATALLTDLAHLSFVFDVLHWERGSQKWMVVVASIKSGKSLYVE